MEKRICCKCKQSKKIEDMCKDSNRKNGIRNVCKDCRKIISRQMREKYAKAAGKEIKPYEPKAFSYLTDEELLGYLVKFKNEFGRPPTSVDLDGLEGYPHVRTFYRIEMLI